MTGRRTRGISSFARTAALSAALAFAAVAFAGAAIAGESAAGEAEPVVRLALPSGELALGRATAPLTMIEFTDYQCPYCRRFQAEVWPKLKREYIDTGKLRYIARDLPLVAIHAAAAPAAEAAHCAGEQGKFWDMHAALLAGTADLGSGGIERRASALGLDMARFDECLARKKYADVIRAHAQEAEAAGIEGTPGFVIGRAADGELTGVRVEGALPYEDFDSLLRELLARH
jgi:protein-disulfide isomerase